MTWNVLEYLSLFLIVLMHEFGHQLACRQVGGQTHDIVLWPLGGVAYVSPPQRPGAQLWSIAAGPLVNVVLVPLLAIVVSACWHAGLSESHRDVYELLHNVWYINLGLLIFNLLPIYPLDGGQIVRSLLWFQFGRAKSLLVASFIGFIGVAGLIGFAILGKSVWIGIMSAFIAMNCWSGWKQAQALARVAKLPRRNEFACPSCKTAPPIGEFWRCGKCGQPFDLFLNHGICPNCSTPSHVAQCLDCGVSNSLPAWNAAPTIDV
jgi:Zn-dependent protease